MRSALRKDLIREIRRSAGRFFAILAIVLIGVAFYAGVSASPNNMRRTADTYFDESRMMDIRLVSSIGFNEEDLNSVRGTTGVSAVYGAHTMDVLMRIGDDESEAVAALTSIPDDLSGDNASYLNRFRIYEGRLPENENECVVRYSTAKTQPIAVGDTLYLSSGTETPLEESLTVSEVTVVGIVYLPTSISFTLGTSTIGNGSISFLMYLPESAFKADYYTNIYLTVDGADTVDAFDEAYFDVTDPVTEALEALGESRIATRTEEIRQEICDTVEEEVTKEVTEAVTEEVEKAVTEEIEKTVREEVEKAVREGIEEATLTAVEAAVREGIEEATLTAVQDAVREGIERATLTAVQTAVREGIESATLAAVQDAVREGIESATLAAVEAAVREGIERATLAAVEAAVREGIEEATLTAVQAAVKEGIERAVLTSVEEAVEAAITEGARSAVQEAVKAQIESAVEAQVRAEVLSGLEQSTKAQVTEAVTAQVTSDPAYAGLPEEALQSVIDAGVSAAFPAALEQAKAQYLENYVAAAYPAALDAAMKADYEAACEAAYPKAVEEALAANYQKTVDAQYPAALEAAMASSYQTTVDEQYPAALESAMASNYQKTVDEQYPAALESAMASNFRTTVDEQYPAALEAAMASNYQKTVDEEYPAALETAMASNYRKTVDEEYPKALETAMASNYQKTVDEEYPAALETAMEENFRKTVDEEYSAALEKAMAENYRKTVDEEYPEALAEAMEENFQKTVDENVPVEVEKLLQEKIDEVTEEQLSENLDGSGDWKWYVLDRNSQESYVAYSDAADTMVKIAAIFPVFFLFVAALVCFTTMTRMVAEQRQLIGTYKALGYSRRSIAARYVIYALSASLIGGLLGCVIGMLVFPIVIFNAWGIAYQMPPMLQADNTLLCIVSVLSITAVVVLAALLACMSELREVPAELMRPKAPKAGKKVFLEYFPAIWRRVSFLRKVTIRNIFRYKKRFFMTLVGVAGCTALLVTGFGISDSVTGLVETQYEKIFRYDMQVTAKAGLEAADTEAVLAYASAQPEFAETMTAASMSGASNVTTDATREQSDIGTTLVVLHETDKLDDFFTFRRASGRKTEVGLPARGVAVSQRTAELLGLSRGDTYYLENSDGIRREVYVAEIIEFYVGHYAYMSEDYYEEVFGEQAAPNLVLGILTEEVCADSARTDALGELLLSDDRISGVGTFANSVKTIKSMISALTLITIVLIISSGLLAFVVLYNLSNVNISERIREIATIKVLGFHDPEVNAYVYRETIAITVFGALFGIPLGIGLHHMIMGAIAMETVTFGNYINPLTYLYSFLLTVGFAVIVSFFINIKLKRIPMVESLKSVE